MLKQGKYIRLLSLRSICNFLFFYSNLQAVWVKFCPEKDSKDKKYPTGILWMIGIWVSGYGLMYQFYDSSKSKLSNITGMIIADHLINKVAETQHWEQNKEPSLKWPLRALGREKNQEVITQLKYFIQRENKALTGANLKNAFLDSINLTGGVLDSAQLEGADLSFSKLDSVSFQHSDLRKSKTVGISIKGSDLSFTRLNWKEIEIKNIRGSTFNLDTIKGIYFGNEDLAYTKFTNCVFSHTKFEKTNLAYTWFKNCEFINCVLIRPNLYLSDMEGAKFFNTPTDSADFTTVHRIEKDSYIKGYKISIENDSRLIKE